MILDDRTPPYYANKKLIEEEAKVIVLTEIYPVWEISIHYVGCPPMSMSWNWLMAQYEKCGRGMVKIFWAAQILLQNGVVQGKEA